VGLATRQLTVIKETGSRIHVAVGNEHLDERGARFYSLNPRAGVESFRIKVAAQSLPISSNVIASDPRAEGHARVHQIGNASNSA
jgi:hypothetical protein